MIAKLEIGENPLTSFKLNGLTYQRGLYEIFYRDVIVDSNGDLVKSLLKIGLRNKITSEILINPVNYSFWTNSVDVSYIDLDSLILDLTTLSFKEGGGNGSSGVTLTQTQSSFSSLEDGENVGDLAYVENSQGTAWLPLGLGGNYYPAGWYVWNGTIWESDRNAIANQLEQSILNIAGNDSDILQTQTDLSNEISNRISSDNTLQNNINSEESSRTIADNLLQNNIDSTTIDNRIIVKQASDLSGILDSSKTYLIDGFIDMGSTQIEVPSTGLFIEGLDYFVSGLYSSTDNHTLFTTPTGSFSGNFKMSRCTIYTSGINSKLFDLDNQNNFAAIEFESVNIGDFSVETTEVGELTSYRQFRTNDCAFIRIKDGLIFSGTWAGGFRIGDTIMLSIPSGTTVFKEGTTLNFIGSSVSDLNAISVDNSATIFDFQDSNFTRDEGFSLNGARFNINSNPVPNMSLSTTKRYFRDCSGIKNTFAGSRWEITTQVITPLTVGTLVKANGITTYDDLVHFRQSTNNAPIYNSTIVKDFVVTGQLIVDGGANDEIDLVLRHWDDSLGAYINKRIFRRNISNIVGGLDIAYFDAYDTITLDFNDRIEFWIRNNDDNTNATLVAGSFIAINVRS